MLSRAALLAALGLAAGLVFGCAASDEQPGTASQPSGASADSPRADSPSADSPSADSPGASSSASPGTSPSGSPRPTPAPDREPVEPRRSYVSIPALDLHDFPVVRYRGAPDDAPGTRIQDANEMASPRGPRGGAGPGEVGNYIVTGHRLTGAAPLRHAPSLRRGDLITVRSGDVVHTYEVVRTRKTSFRSTESLAAQRAPVPGRPGEDATQAMLTLSTCATPEDHAVGNFWSDEFGNPEHRIDKIAVLRSSRPAS